MLRCFEKFSPRIRHRFPTRPACRPSSPQRCGTCHLHVQNHFIAGLCSVDKNFPLHLWDKLLPRAELTLNLVCGSCLNPKLSARAQLNGAFDFNCTPLAPPSIRVLVHVKPADRTTWSPHGADGWYVRPALESHYSYSIWLWETQATRICDTLTSFPTNTTMPLASSNDLSLAGIQDIFQCHSSSFRGFSTCSSHRQSSRCLNSVNQHSLDHRYDRLSDNTFIRAQHAASCCPTYDRNELTPRYISEGGHSPHGHYCAHVPTAHSSHRCISEGAHCQNRHIYTLSNADWHHVCQQHWHHWQTTSAHSSTKQSVLFHPLCQNGASQQALIPRPP